MIIIYGKNLDATVPNNNAISVIFIDGIYGLDSSEFRNLDKGGYSLATPPPAAEGIELPPLPQLLHPPGRIAAEDLPPNTPPDPPYLRRKAHWVATNFNTYVNIIEHI